MNYMLNCIMLYNKYLEICKVRIIYTVNHKKTSHFIFYYNFG